MRTTPRLKVAARLTITSTECEYPVTKPGNSRETIDVSEVADFSVDQQQHAEVEASRKKGFWLVARSPAGCVIDRVILNLQSAASPLHREEEPISVPKSYRRGRFASSDIGTCGDVRSAPNSKCRGRTSVRLRPPGPSSQAGHFFLPWPVFRASYSSARLNSTMEPGPSLRGTAPGTPISRLAV